MQNRPGVRQIAADRASRLPWLAPPAGYIVLIQDVAYGNRYKIARHQQLDQHQIERGADFPFATRVVLILEAENAAEAERDLQDELAAGTTLGDWFDLARFPQTPPAPTPAPAPTQMQESVSLLDLVENDEGADSLLQEADIVATKGHVSAPRRRARPQPTRPRRRRPRAARWAFALGLLVFIGVFAAEHGGNIGRVIESMLNAGSRQSNIPTPAANGSGEVFFTSASARLRICAADTCRVVDLLDPGTRITAQKFVKGLAYKGSTRWIQYLHRGELRYIHDSELSRAAPPVEPKDSTDTDSGSASLTPEIEGRDEVFFTKTRTRVRSCANMFCSTVDFLSSGSKITARSVVSGQLVNGSARWIAFLYWGRLRYIHDSELSRTWPPIDSTATNTNSASPTTRISGKDEVFYTNTYSRVRYCANMSCRTDAFLGSGTKITAHRYVTGQQVNGSDRWIAFQNRGELRYIHDSELSRTWPLVEPTPPPSPTAQPTRIKATAVGRGEEFYVRSIANARRCARLSCEVWDILLPGTKITALRFLQGQEIDSNDLWIRFSHNGRHLSIHSGDLSRTAPTAQPTRIRPTAVGQGEVFYVRERAIARACAQTSCEILEVMPPGAKITALSFETGQPLHGSDHWIRFSHSGRHLSIHSGKLSRTDPNAAAFPTAPPADSTTYTVIAGATFYTNQRASVRKCAHLTCEVDVILPPGTQITATGYTVGQKIEGDDRWVVLDHQGRSRFVHSSMLSTMPPPAAPASEPSPAAQQTQRNQSSTADETPLYVSERATVYKCVYTSCQSIDVLERGAMIYPSGKWYGQQINDSNAWFRFRHEDHTVYIHSSFVTEYEPIPEPTADSTPTRQPTAIQPSGYVSNRYYYVRSLEKASFRNCANRSCDEVGVLPPGMRVWALQVVRGESIYGNDIWIKFDHGNRKRYVHSRLLSPLSAQGDADVDAPPPAPSSPTDAPPPTATATATETMLPTAAATVASAAKYVVETAGNANAHIRACPRTNCEIVAKYAPGTEVEVIGMVAGETVYGTDAWYEINFEAGSAFLHSELAAKAG
ncbi:MAG: SH3 domain-containing protein [Chloroflexi bacterium]|nr:SH3 domain-containing protein [Chloroflexota bacterium]